MRHLRRLIFGGRPLALFEYTRVEAGSPPSKSPRLSVRGKNTSPTGSSNDRCNPGSHQVMIETNFYEGGGTQAAHYTSEYRDAAESCSRPSTSSSLVTSTTPPTETFWLCRLTCRTSS